MSKVLKRSRRAGREGDEEHWIPLSDLMTSLMFLFLLIALAYMVQVQQQSTRTIKIVDTVQQQRDALYDELNREFGRDWSTWDAHLSPDLSIRFSKPGALFEPGSAKLQPRFETILRDFFPRYVRILDSPEHRSLVRELRIEGTASSDRFSAVNLPSDYLGDMQLSQDRAREVLGYVLPLAGTAPHRHWLTSHVTADGLAGSHPITVNGRADAVLSQRVDFRVMDPLWDRIAQEDTSQSERKAPSRGAMAVPYSVDAIVAPGSAPVLVNLDPHPVVHVKARHQVTVIGWAIAPSADSPAGAVSATVDGTRRIAATYGLVRDDVAFALRKPALNRVGFAIDIPAQSLSAGRHHFDIVIENARGKQDYVARDRFTLIAQ